MYCLFFLFVTLLIIKLKRFAHTSLHNQVYYSINLVGACWMLPEVPQLRQLCCGSGWYENANQNGVACAFKQNYIVSCDLQVYLQCNTLTVITRNRAIYHTLTVSLVKISMLLAIIYILPKENTTRQKPFFSCLHLQ